MEDKEKIICRICQQNSGYTDNASFLIFHVKKIHGIDQKQYYDHLVKKPNEGICKICQEPTKFIKFSKGYREYCGSRCANLDPLTKEKAQKTYFDKTGYKHNSQNPEVLDRQKKTNLDKYGVENYFESDDFKKKDIWTPERKAIHAAAVKAGVQKIYGVDNVFQLQSVMKHSGDIFREKTKEKLMSILPSGYVVSNYVSGNPGTVTITCDVGHQSTTTVRTIEERLSKSVSPCNVCSPMCPRSKGEQELYEFICGNYGGLVLVSNKTMIFPNELDIYIPDLSLAFEYNGLYWHNEISVSQSYHLDKTTRCSDKGIHLIHVYEDDWQNPIKQEIIKSRILNLIGKSSVKLFARKCRVATVSSSIARDFCDTNHIQGKCQSKINLGLYYENELVSLMTFGMKRVHMGNSKPDPLKWELLRFCSKLNYNVVGAASKLFAAFVKDNEFTEIVSYADRSWSSGGVYQKLGFSFDGETKPNYFYIIDDKRVGRFSFAKHVLVKKGFDSSKTEKEIMFERGIYRIYDSGSLKFVYRKTNETTTESEKTEN